MKYRFSHLTAKKCRRGICAALCAVFTTTLAPAAPSTAEVIKWETPESPAVTYNMNIDWRYLKPSQADTLSNALESSKSADGKYFYEVDFDDSAWEGVSIPHAINGQEAFANYIVDAGERGASRCFLLYRKTFTVPESAAGGKVFFELEGIRQAAYVWVNGQKVGYYEAGLTPFGFDLTGFVTPGEEAVIALAEDGTSSRGATSYISETRPGSEWGARDGYSYQWNTKDFNNSQIGLIYDAYLHITGDVYQTLPLYNNLKTTGNYIWADNFDIRENKARINVKAEVRNESGTDENVTLEVAVVDYEGNVKWSFASGAQNIAAASDAGVTFETAVESNVYDLSTEEHDGLTEVNTVDVSYITASIDAGDVRFWNLEDPYLYTVYTMLKDSEGNVIDLQKKKTGFRKVEYTNESGLLLNDKAVWLSGYAQRSTNEWAAIGSANDWMTDYDMSLVKESNASYIRWMHVTPKPATVRSSDKYGVVVVCPAGDKEGDATGRTWSQRTEGMRDAMIYFRNSPSVFFWEAGNNSITSAHMTEMVNLKNRLDPTGGRFCGSRSLQGTENVQAAEFVGTMLNRHASTAKGVMNSTGKFMPIIETEYAREEAPRRVWDDYSPPDYDYVGKWLGDDGSKTDGYDIWDMTSEDFVLANVKGFAEFYNDRAGVTRNNYYAAWGALCWTDSNQHGRNSASENARMSGRVDPIRLKKQSFYAYQVMQSQEPAVHIVGHWSYPEYTETSDNYYYYDRVWDDTGSVAYWRYVRDEAHKLRRDPTKKTVYVIGTTDCERIDLAVDGTVIASCDTPQNTFTFAFENIDVTQGDMVEAIAYNARNEEIARDRIVRTGEAVSVRLTPYHSPDGFMADGADICYFDVEVLDANGNVCDLNYDQINFQLSGEGVWLGGYNSGKFGENSVIGKDYVFAECGTNRVFVKSTRNAGTVTLTAYMQGMMPASVTVETKAVANEGGLTTVMPSVLDPGVGVQPVTKVVSAQLPLADVFHAVWANRVTVKDIVDTKDYYSITYNGTEVEFASEPYAMNDVVFAPVVTILELLKQDGIDFEYSYNGTNELTLVAGGKTIIATAGKTTLQVDDEVNANLLNNEPWIENGEFYCEVSPILGYISGVKFSRDAATKTYNITVGEGA